MTNTTNFRQLNILINISQSLISTLDYEKVLQIISDGMSELLEIETAAIYLLENENDLMMGAATPPLDPNMPQELRKALVDDHPHIKLAIQERKPQIIPDTTNAVLSGPESVVVQMRNLRSLIYLPFIHENIVLGVLILGTCNKSRVYSEEEINFGQTVANQLSISIQNTLLHADLNNYKDHLELLVKEKTRDLDSAIEELRTKNEELSEKHAIIENQNIELKTTLNFLHETQTKLIQAEKMASIGTLTAGIAHEINNPLNFIKGASSGLEEYYMNHEDCRNDETEFLLNSIKTGIERISNIISGLSQFSRSGSIMDEDCDIHSIMNNCLLMLNNQIKSTIEIDKDYLDNPVIIKGNVGKLHQVFLNILLNAVQSITGSGKISIRTKHNRVSDIYIIEISDTGSGIKEEILQKVTDPFFTTKDPGKGTGLGLSITYTIIQEHKGTLDFESEPGIGTVVRITLPKS